jgi:osmotically-inducible protein OsmY
MFCLQGSMRPDSVTSMLVERQMQRWHDAQASQRAAERSAPSDEPRVLAQARLSASPFLALRTLECQGQNGHVTIRGRVPTGYLKELSGLLVKSIGGVRRVTNEVEVFPLGWAAACRG